MAAALEAWRVYAVSTQPASSSEGIGFVSMLLAVALGLPANLLTLALIDIVPPAQLRGLNPQHLLLGGIVVNAACLAWAGGKLMKSPGST